MNDGKKLVTLQDIKLMVNSYFNHMENVGRTTKGEVTERLILSFYQGLIPQELINTMILHWDNLTGYHTQGGKDYLEFISPQQVERNKAKKAALLAPNPTPLDRLLKAFKTYFEEIKATL